MKIAYGEFMQFLGNNADIPTIRECLNSTTLEEHSVLNDIRTRLFEKISWTHEISIQRTSEMNEFEEFDEFVVLLRTKKDVTIICEYLNSHPQLLEEKNVSF